MSAVEVFTGPAEVLEALWSSLERKGAVVDRRDPSAMGPEEIEAHIEDAGRRLRALREAHIPGPKPLPSAAVPARRDDLRQLLVLLAKAAGVEDLPGDQPAPMPRGTVPYWVDLDYLDHLEPPARWRARAACVGIDPEVFFDPGPTSDYAAAAQVCAGCPVAYACLVTHLRETSGYWGNTSPNDRIAIRRALRTRRAAA